MPHPTIISVVSGKGGTGKSLSCALLGRLLAQESAKVLLVDFDIFVRGLTYLFYLYTKERRILTKGPAVVDLLAASRSTPNETIVPEQFFEIYIVPAVREIEQVVEYDYLPAFGRKLREHTSLQGSDDPIMVFFDQLRGLNFDYIFVDQRAGVDELIVGACASSDLTLAVTEGDPVARSTHENLVRQLKQRSTGKIYSIINKAKYLDTHEEYVRQSQHIKGDFELLGQIPFDADLFQSFGTTGFWDHINSTKYAYALSEAWNKLARRETLEHSIEMQRFKPSRIWDISRGTPSFLNQVERLSVFGGVMCIFAYFAYDFIVYEDRFEIKHFFLLYALLLIAMPALRRLLMVDPGFKDRSKR